MKLDELQSVQSRERQTDSLQQLRESFYADAGEFIQQLRDERDRAAEHAEDPFDSPEVNRLTDDIKTAEQTVEAVYERRVGKIVKMASLAAADMPTEEEGLTREERDLFETLVGAIESNRDHVLDVLAGEASPGSVSSGAASNEATGDSTATETTEETGSTAETPVPDPEGESPAAGGVDAADVMGGDADAPEPGTSDDAHPVPPEEPPGDNPVSSPDGRDPETDTPASGAIGDEDGQTSDDSDADDGVGDGVAVERRTVRITDDVGAILGVDEREYDLSTDDVVTLPAANAEPLVERDAAEPLNR